jgi:CubicO group peptidase (beta-lactamase class C family)
MKTLMIGYNEEGFIMLALKRTLAALLFALLVFPVLSRAQQLELAKPEDVGFSRERLDRIAGTLNADIAKGTIPGATLLIVRNGKIGSVHK